LDSLEILRNQSIESDLDCYLIRLRIGILYFNEKKYALAKREFIAALKFNSYDTLLFEYIYYCQVYLSKINEAEFEALSFPPVLQKKIGLRKNTLIRNLELNYGYFEDATQNINIPSNYLTTGGNPPPPPQFGPNTNPIFNLISQNKNQDMRFYNISLNSNLFSRLNITNSFGQFNLNKQSIFKANGVQYIFNSTLKQNDLATTAALIVNKKITLGLAYHYSSLQFTSILPVFDNYAKLYYFNKSSVKEYNHVFYASFKFNLDRGWLEPSYSLSSINNSKIQQINTGLFIYPFSGNRFYINNTLSGIINNNSTHILVNAKFGLNIWKRTTLENGFYWGSLMNYNENGAQIVYNLSDDIKFKYAANIYIRINKHLQFAIYGSILKRETEYDIYNLQLQKEIINLNYYQKNITGGIIWNY